MEQFIIQIINEFGYIGILFLIAIENVFPPIPSEIILTFGGFSTIITDLTIEGVIIFSIIGSIIGSIILYLLGRLLSKEKLEKIIDGKIGKVLRINKTDIEKAFKSFEKRGKITVFICRFIPVLRSLISIPAGMTKMKFIPFIILTTIGSTIWNIVLIKLGEIAGESWQSIALFVDKYSLMVVILILIVLFIIIYNKYLNKKEKEYVSIKEREE